jgi:hypothetical protein
MRARRAKKKKNNEKKEEKIKESQRKIFHAPLTPQLKPL